MDEENITIKARCNINLEIISRKIFINKNITFEDLEYKLRERFDINYDKNVDIYYIDEENERIFVTYEEELTLALKSQKSPTFDVVVKPKNIDDFFTYPLIPKCKVGDIVDVLIESHNLTIPSVFKNDTKVWGTFVFTDDSDIVKALAHSEKIELTDIPPPYNLIVTIRYLPGCIEYIGSINQGISTLSYGRYDLSYIIEGIRSVKSSSEKSL